MANYQAVCNCGKIVNVELSYQQYNEIRAGVKKIQDIMPFNQYTAEQREMFVSGMCQECWDELFKDDEDDQPCVQALSEEEVNEMLQDEYERKADESAKEDFDAIKYDLNQD